MTVAVVIVTHRAPPGVLERAVDSVLEHSWGVAVHVVDNGGSASVRLAGHDPSVAARISVTTTDNHGFGAAANLGIRRSVGDGADVVVILNDDVEVASGWLEPLVAELADPGVGAVQPLLVTPDGRAINSAGVEIDRFGAGTDRGRGEPIDSVGSEPVDLEVFTGGAVLVRSDFVRAVGGFDERFFLYYEDVELALRGAAAGWRYRLVPAVHVVHQGSATTGGLGDDLVRLRERNRLWSSAMWGSNSTLRSGVWLSMRRLRHRPRRAHARGLVSGLAGAFTRRRHRHAGTTAGASVV